LSNGLDQFDYISLASLVVSTPAFLAFF
jgi:hypothetical protein